MEMAQFAKLRRHAGQLVIANVYFVNPGEISDFRWQGRQVVPAEVERGQARHREYLIRHACQVAADEAQPPRALDLAIIGGGQPVIAGGPVPFR